MGNCHFKTDFDAENITGKFWKIETESFESLIKPASTRGLLIILFKSQYTTKIQK